MEELYPVLELEEDSTIVDLEAGPGDIPEEVLLEVEEDG